MSWISFILRSTVAESVGSQRASTASLTCWMVAASVSGSGRESQASHQTEGPHFALLGSAAAPGWVALLEEVCCSPLHCFPKNPGVFLRWGLGVFPGHYRILVLCSTERRRDVGTAVAAKCLCHRKLWA